MFLLCSWCPSLVFPSPSLHESFCSDWLIAGSIFTSPCFYSTTPLFLKKAAVAMTDVVCVLLRRCLQTLLTSRRAAVSLCTTLQTSSTRCPQTGPPVPVTWLPHTPVTFDVFSPKSQTTCLGGLSAVAMKVKTQRQVRTTLVVPGNESKSFPVSAVNFSRIRSSFLKFAFTRVVFYKMSNVWVTHKKDFYLCSHWV